MITYENSQQYEDVGWDAQSRILRYLGTTLILFQLSPSRMSCVFKNIVNAWHGDTNFQDLRVPHHFATSTQRTIVKSQPF